MLLKVAPLSYVNKEVQQMVVAIKYALKVKTKQIEKMLVTF
jgi:hypothetical protein